MAFFMPNKPRSETDKNEKTGCISLGGGGFHILFAANFLQISPHDERPCSWLCNSRY